MSVIEDLKEMGRQVTQELPPEENDRMGFKCIGVVLAVGATALATEAGVDWAAQGTPINRQTIGSTAVALVLAMGSNISWRRGHRSPEAADASE